MEKLIPYSLYVTESHAKKLKKLSQQKQASAFVRDALVVAFDGKDMYKTAYGSAIQDAIKVIKCTKELKMMVVDGERLDLTLTQKLNDLGA
jgi:predicted SpoU family rRNA methylase